jgi:hypothetical protein
MTYERRRILGGGLIGCALLLVNASAAPASTIGPNGFPEPFTATYGVSWNGITAGSATLELAREDADQWLYRSVIAASGLVRLVFPEDILQSSRFSIAGETLQPLEYSATDGARDHRRDIHLRFDTSQQRITGTANLAPVDLALQAGTLDPMSLQIATLRALAAGRDPTHFLMIDQDEIKDYRYTFEGKARLHTELGDLETVIWTSSRPESDRMTRMWYAPALGFIPVRAEQLRGGKPQLRLDIRTLTRP